MRIILISFLLTFATGSLAQHQALTLGNEPWPPYVLAGEEQGTAERIVCEALQRAGWDCTIKRGDWAETLQQASVGELDGIAALWHTAKRASSMRYSAPYLTNRLVPVIRKDSELMIGGLDDLALLRIAAEENFAYGDEIEKALASLMVTRVTGVDNALRAVQSGKVDVALIDELVAWDFVDQPGNNDLSIGRTALSYRELYFAVSMKHPQNAEIIAAFNEAYRSMLKDGTINRILDIDWVVTDLKQDGIPDFIYRGGEYPDSAKTFDTVYPIDQKGYQMIHEPGFTGADANFSVNGIAQEDSGLATDTIFKPKKPCHYDSASGRIVCPMK